MSFTRRFITGQLCENEPDTACSDMENPDMDNLCLENRSKLKKRKHEEQSTYSPSVKDQILCNQSPKRLLGYNKIKQDKMKKQKAANPFSDLLPFCMLAM